MPSEIIKDCFLHHLLLLATFHDRNPANPILDEQLKARLCCFDLRVVIHDPSLDNPHAWQRFPDAKQSRSTVCAEVSSDVLATYAGRGEGPGRAARDGEALFGDDEVDAMGAAADLAAVAAVAEDL